MQLFWGLKTDRSHVIVEGEDVVHLSKSLRKKEGDMIQVIDGSGYIYNCNIIQVSRNQVVGNIIREELAEKKWKARLHVGIALTKNIDRIEWFVEKAVEMGIDRISFIGCERSVRSNLRMDRIMRIVQATMKQSFNVHLPIVDQLDFKELAAENSNPATQKLIAHCSDGKRSPLSEALQPGTDCLILIGPEGDFALEEIEFASAHAFQPVSMGLTRLRTETAGMMAVAVFQSRSW